VTVDGQGNVWVGDMPGFRAQVFSPSGQFLFQVPASGGEPPEGGFNQPRGVSVDAQGNVFVTDTHNWRVQKPFRFSF
jgi:sugar lactone lactonase YvrE